MSKTATKGGTLGGYRPLNSEDVLNIYKMSL
jgi:hypothetical protein